MKMKMKMKMQWWKCNYEIENENENEDGYDDDDKTIEQNKIKKLNNYFDKTIDKSKSFINLIKIMMIKS